MWKYRHSVLGPKKWKRKSYKHVIHIAVDNVSKGKGRFSEENEGKS